MELLLKYLDFLMHIDKHLSILITDYGMWIYVIFFVIIFCETGLVVTPFLPGDSLLFAAGAFAAIGALDVWWILLVVAAAAIAGDTVNYWAGHIVGPKIFHKENVRFLNKKHLERTHQFYEKHGGKTIIIARFIPIIRTFAPFVAGIGKMSYLRFISFNVIGGILWPILFVFAGYFFGNIPIVKRYFSLVILAIIIISVMPIVIEYMRIKLQSRREILEASEN
jgi:membrane-associated protein